MFDSARLRGISLVAFALLALVALTALTTPITENHFGYDSDGRNYGAMAGDPAIPAEFRAQAPWCYRVLTPWLASLLPLPTLTAFRVLAFGSSFVSLALMLGLLGQLGFAPALRWVGLLLYAGVFWALKFSFYSPAYVDHVTQTFLLLVLVLTVRRAWLPLVPVLVLAALQKESLAVYALFPVAMLWTAPGEPRGARRGALTAALLALPAAAVLAVRQLVPATNAFSLLQSVFAEAGSVRDALFWAVLLHSVLSGLGVLPALLAFRPSSWVSVLRRERAWAVYAALSLFSLLGGYDKARLFLYFLPLGVVLVLRALESWGATGRPRALAVWAIAVLPMHAFIGGYLTPMGSFLDYLDRHVPEHSPGGFVTWLWVDLALNAAAFAFTWAQWSPKERRSGSATRGRSPRPAGR